VAISRLELHFVFHIQHLPFRRQKAVDFFKHNGIKIPNYCFSYLIRRW
jgi:hypothetical protein